MENEEPRLRELVAAADKIARETKIDRIVSVLHNEYAGRQVLFFTEYKATSVAPDVVKTVSKHMRAKLLEIKQQLHRRNGQDGSRIENGSCYGTASRLSCMIRTNMPGKFRRIHWNRSCRR
jgi:hypothetical protein